MTDLKPLLPCPWCGSADLVFLKGGPTLHDAIKCRPCNLYVPLTVEQWNRRAALSAPANGKPCEKCEGAAELCQMLAKDSWHMHATALEHAAYRIRSSCRHDPTPSGEDVALLTESNKHLHISLANQTIARRAWERNYMKMGWTEKGARLQTELLIKEYTDENAIRALKSASKEPS